jgi:hypothetical protein
MISTLLNAYQPSPSTRLNAVQRFVINVFQPNSTLKSSSAKLSGRIFSFWPLIAGHRWLDFTQAGPRNFFYTVCFAPVLLQMLVWNWWRRKMLKRSTQN